MSDHHKVIWQVPRLWGRQIQFLVFKQAKQGLLPYSHIPESSVHVIIWPCLYFLSISILKTNNFLFGFFFFFFVIPVLLAAVPVCNYILAHEN